MKHTRLIFLLSFLVMRLYGQTDLASIALNGKPTDVITSRDQKGNVFFLFQYGKSYEMVLLDSSYKETKRVNIKRAEDDSKKNSLVGTIFDERGAVAYLMNAKTNEFFAMKIDRQTGSMEFNSLGKLANEEYFLKGIELDGKFHVLAVPKQENQINLYTSDYGNPFTIQKYPIDFSSLYQKLSFKNEELNQRNESPVGIDYLRYDQEHSVKSAHSKKKLYTFQGNIYLIFDEATCTHVIRIRPDAGTSSYKKLNFSLDKDLNTIPRQGNSFFYKGDLFRATMSNKQLNLSIIYLDSTMLLRGYNFYPDKTIEIANGVIVQSAMDGQDRVIQKTSQFFNKVLDGELSIAANSLPDGRYEVQLGSYESITTYRNTGPSLGGWGMPGLSIGFGFGSGIGFGYPYYDPFYYPGAAGNTITTVQVCYFQSLLRQSDLEHVEGAVPPSANKKMEDYIDKNFRSSKPELMQFMASDQGVIMGLYSKNNGKYKLLIFRRN